jgi:serine/threonine protein kinase
MSQQIDQYKILSELGAGGMGVVYRALDVSLDREVAIKRLRSEFAASATVLERFRKEAQIQAKLNHPNIAQLYSLVEDGQSLCIVMEFVDGSNLTRYVPMAWKKALPVILQTLEGLDYAHRRGVLHRDIKPENIVIDVEGTVKVMDFGIAHALGSSRLTRDKSIVGTIEYMSPERILGREMDQRTDLYSVGILLFEMLAGRLPFDSQIEFELLRSHIETEPPPLSQFAAGAPDFVDAAIRKAMAKDPANRFASCAEMASSLREGCAAAGVTLESVAASLNIKPRAAGTAVSQDIQSWCQRIETLYRNGDFESAERLVDVALNDFPGSAEIAACREKIRRAAPRREPIPPGHATPVEPMSEEEAFLRKTLLRLMASEKNADWDDAFATLQSALERRPDGTAFRIAQVYLESKAPPR